MTKVGTYKTEAYEQAVLFRRRGFTYTEIAKICHVSRGTVSNWLKNEAFSQVVAKDNQKKAALDNTKRLSLINKARNTERKNQYEAVVKTAETEYKHYRTSPLFIAGLALYMSIGDHTDERVVRVTGSNSDLHRIFIRFALEYLGIEKNALHIWLLLYPDLNEVTCMKHWIKKTGLNASHFYKNQIVNSRSNKATLHFGVGNTIIGSTLLKRKLETWLLLATKELTIK
jgi:transcriptional regulator with XRE-family HTH domain